MQDPQPDFRPEPGVAEPLSPGLRRVLAPNPSPMTFRGTNTYLLGDSDLAVIDPGPDDAKHLNAILQAIGSDTVSAVFVTHAHVDHSPLSRKLADHVNAPIYAFSNASGGRSSVMQHLAKSGLVGGGEGVDATFQPDVQLADGDVVKRCFVLRRSGDGMGQFTCLSARWRSDRFHGVLSAITIRTLVSFPFGTWRTD